MIQSVYSSLETLPYFINGVPGKTAGDRRVSGHRKRGEQIFLSGSTKKL